jgi:hypothetical protein
MRARMLGALLVAAMVPVPASASAPAPSSPVRLVLPHERLHPGENVPLRLVGPRGRTLFHSSCPRLERSTAQGWRAITRSHGARVGCPLADGGLQSPHVVGAPELILYDDLVPGTYRVTLYVRVVPRHWRVLSPLNARDQVLQATFVLHRAPRLRRPKLPESRLLAIAEAAATNGGDAHPTLIQHAAGRRYEANLVAGGGEVFEWSWCYLIAIRGHFTFANAPVPPGAKAPSGSVLTLVLDAATGEGLDFGVSNRYPDLARLGPVTTDLG